MKILRFTIFIISLFLCSCDHKGQNKHIGNIADTLNYALKTEKEAEPIILNRCPNDSDVILFMKNRDQDSFNNLCFRYLKSDSPFEVIFYALVAVDKFNISRGYAEFGSCLTKFFSYMSVSNHSKEIAIYFLQKGARNNNICAERLDIICKDKEYPKLWLPNNKDGDPFIALKVNTIKGSIKDYNKLKNAFYDNNQPELLIYYSFLMADRYNYVPAREDVIKSLKQAYKKYNLGEFGEDTKYFCSFFQED